MKAEYQKENWKDREGRPAGGVASGTGFCISWQNGSLTVDGGRREPNGAFVETIIDATLERIKFYQEGQFHCEENSLAILHLEAAMDALSSRTNRRVSQNIEGTHIGN